MTDPAGAVAQLLAQGSELRAQGHLEEAAGRYEAALARDPRAVEAWFELGELYDARLLDFERAARLFGRYLERWPDGPMAGPFRERLAFLERHRADWPVIRAFRVALAQQGERAQTRERIVALLDANPTSSFRPDLLLWIATDLAEDEPRSSLAYFEAYLSLAAPDVARAREVAAAHVVRATVLEKLSRFEQAKDALRRAGALDAEQAPEAEIALRRLAKVQRHWWIFAGCTGALALALVIGVALQWRRTFRWRRLALELAVAVAAMAVVTLVPREIVRRYDGDVPTTFGYLALLGLASLALVRLLSPLARRSRAAYLAASLSIAIAAVYAAFYLGGTVEAFEFPFEKRAVVSEEKP